MKIVEVPLIGVVIFVLSFLAFYFGIPLLIASFAATLYTIFLHRESEFAQTRNVFGSHVLGFLGALIAPFLTPYLGMYIPAGVLLQAIVVAVAVTIASLLMVITSVEHPPAAATALLFSITEQKGILLSGIVSLESLTGFAAGLILITLVAHFFTRQMV